MANKKEMPDVSLASEKSKAKQQRLALIAGLTITFGIVLIIVLIFMQKSQIEENNVVTTMSIDKLQENVDTLDSSTEELRTQLEGMLEQLNSMDSVIQTNKETVESINTTATGSGENIARAEKDILALQKTLSEYIKQFESETTNTNSEIKEQFNTVNNDVEKLLQEINNNNDNQTTNYKELSSQMDKTLKDMNSFIEKLSKENDTQYKELTKQTEEFETKLNEYLETFNTELNATIKEDIDGVNTHLDTVQNDIATTKKEITDLLNDIDNKQTQDLQTKFDAIQKHLNDMTTHYDEVLADITDLINKLSAQNKKEFEDTINKLTSVQTDLTTLNNDIADEMNTTLSNMQKDYTKQITDLQTNVNNSFDNVETQIANTNSEINEKLDTQNSYLDQKFDGLTQNFNDKLEIAITNSNSDTEELKKMLEDYQQEVKQSFTSVSNGKRTLHATLLTKYNQMGAGVPKGADGNDLKVDGSFDDFKTAIDNIELVKDNVIPVPNDGSIVFDHHIHSLEQTDKIESNDSLSVKSITENLEYTDTYESDTPSGCYTEPLYYYSYTYQSGTTSQGWIWKPSGNGYVCNACGAYADHECPCPNPGCQPKPIYSTASGTSREYPSQGYQKTVYTRSCNHSQGEVTDAHIHYN